MYENLKYKGIFIILSLLPSSLDISALALSVFINLNLSYCRNHVIFHQSFARISRNKILQGKIWKQIKPSNVRYFISTDFLGFIDTSAVSYPPAQVCLPVNDHLDQGPSALPEAFRFFTDISWQTQQLREHSYMIELPSQ